MRIGLLLILLLLPLAGAQNETTPDENQTVDAGNMTDGPPDSGLPRTTVLAVNGVALVVLVGAFVYVARR